LCGIAIGRTGTAKSRAVEIDGTGTAKNNKKSEPKAEG